MFNVISFDKKTISQLALSSGASNWLWVCIALMSFALLASALFFQHVLDALPCEICVYVRVWIAAIGLVALLALGIKRWFYGKLFAQITTIILSFGLTVETWNLIQIEYNIGHGGACGFFANFPSWAPLDKWFPHIFEVQELCAATPEVLFGISMADSLVLVSAGLIAMLSISIWGNFSQNK